MIDCGLDGYVLWQPRPCVFKHFRLSLRIVATAHNSCAFIRMIKRIGSWRRTNCSVRFARFPHLFARPLTGPFDSNEAVTRDCSYARTNLDQILDLEA